VQQTCMRKLLILLTVSLGTISCRSIDPLPITRLPEGNVKRLMEMPEFTDVKEADGNIKRWAKEALDSINDLEYIIRAHDE